ncbi:helix-turn-helix domain-containing protein [Heyndrickxia ginsengihumi]|uniref:helix-turn-helix domain-containing protein n=1 Tax=Heyndrickxia ginsengihumi TaxID=363870 RepID=UPI000472F7BA|nr:helix-turn-helix transcriptional regulator [Heyndrickxia ginsengihumi]
MRISNRIIHLREKKGWSQKELANRVNLNVSVMNRIESEERPIKDHELKKIAEVLSVSSDYLLGLTNNPSSINAGERFQESINDPELKRWYKELPENDEGDLRRLRKLWEIIKNDK